MTSDKTRVMEVWQASVTACERHLKMAAQLQTDGLRMMQQGRDNGDAKVAADGRRTLMMGVDMEQKTNRELLSLNRNKPKIRT